MANFLTRIELRDATPADYLALDARMATVGFIRTIGADDGRVHALPSGEYIGTAGGTCLQVRDLAVQAAAETGKAFSVVSVEFTNAAWLGLPVAP